MATGLIEHRDNAQWLNVRSGELLDRSTGEVVNWISGIITGIRAVPNGRYDTVELHVRFHDPEDGPGGATYIVSGGLSNKNKTVQLWGRMLLSRLMNEENRLRFGERLTIRFYPWKTDYGISTCCCVKREGAGELLIGSKIRNDDFRTVQGYLQILEDLYPWDLRSLDDSDVRERDPESGNPGILNHRKAMNESLHALYGGLSINPRKSR